MTKSVTWNFPANVLRSGFLSATLPLLFAVITSGLLCSACNTDNQIEETPPILVEVQVASISENPLTRRFSGYTHPWDVHGVGFLVSGRVSKLLVKEGEFVKKGDLIATMDPEDYKLVEQLAQTQVEALEPNFKRVDSLVKNDALPQSKLDEIKGRYDAARTQQKRAERQMKYTRLYAPISGVVHELRTAAGQVIASGSPAVILLDIDRLKLKIGVPQKDLKYFTIGDELEVDVPGVKSGIAGKVCHIDYVADATTRSFSIDVEIQNGDHQLRPSMLANTHITIDRYKGYFVPIHAVMHTLEGSPYLMLVDEATQTITDAAVKIGIRFGEQLQVTEGLKGGEKIVVRGNNFAREGDKVVVR